MKEIAIARKVAIILSATWGAVILAFVWMILTIDTSISFTALAAAAGSTTVEYLLMFLFFAFSAWAFPTAIIWLIAGRLQNTKYP